MNPFFNMMFSFIMANNKAKQYNIADDHEIKTVGLATGMMFDNPILSYVFIDNKAKSVSESLKSAHATTTASQAPGLPASGATTSEGAPAQSNSGGASSGQVLTMEAVKSEIATLRNELTTQISTLSSQMISKAELEKLNSGLASFEKEKQRLNDLIDEIGRRLEEISKNIKTSDAATAAKSVSSKSSSKP
ncbi:hypothetical protein [Flavobacterium sp. KACC 22761]|uniref:hypothetical protein n=1 Tax=Flavobacterium sp. KACC 22761 TaxID=3092665 RepID=UPI002A765E6B|nr:hypothetical protein [Flavobacterium sp. KACC 22761]WPO77925.1 hypothetical protein SCB73_16780 [Flavobacterium sp. KACC 22761]